MAFDILILNGTIVDGTNSPRYRGDVGISNGRIEAIGALGDSEAARRIDAAGHVACPGFIDMHSHSDVTLFDDPGGESKAYQGVTTEVTGNCSYTPFPAGKGGSEGPAGQHRQVPRRRNRVGMGHAGRLGQLPSSPAASASTSRPR